MSCLPETETYSPANPIRSTIQDEDDRQFLLYFIMGTYFGPDIKDLKHHKSALQRKAEHLPAYSSEQLAGSHIKRVDMERVYFYLLRNADKSLRVKLQFLRQYFEGKCKDFKENFLKFTDLFPLKLHQQTQIGDRYRAINNIVFINNPDISYMKPEDIERFKRLTGLQDFLLSKNVAALHTPAAMGVNQVETSEEINCLPLCLIHQETLNGSEPASGAPPADQVGPLVGLMDIGECEDSYLFRVSLPGVKRIEREFSCEVEENGKVVIRGMTTTGEKRVYRYSQVFEMHTQNLCPPGHFTVSFRLPGPVDPLQFVGNFGNDGILEGIVMKKQIRN